MIEIQENYQIEYPSSDGKRMAENTQQFEELVKIKLNLEKTTAGKNIFVAGDLLWYPVQGQRISMAPDVMVAIGRPKGHRDSYLQWKEDNIAPQVAFEIWSPSNRSKEKKNKLAFYEEHGVQEYYTWSTHKNILQVYIRNKTGLKLVPKVKDWTSQLLGIRLYWTNEGLELYHPNGERFLSYMELVEHHSEAVENLKKMLHLFKKVRLELKTTKSDLEVTKSDLEVTKSDLEVTKSDLEVTKSDLEVTKSDLEVKDKKIDELAEKNRKLIEKLTALGLNPDEI